MAGTHRKINKVKDVLWEQEQENSIKNDPYSYQDMPDPGMMGGLGNLSRLNSSQRILTIVAKNNTDYEQEVRLFDRDFFKKIQSNGKVSITVAQASYEAVLTKILQMPLNVDNMKIEVDDQQQFDNWIEMGHMDIRTGACSTMSLIPNYHVSPYQNIMTIVDIPDVNYRLDMDSFMAFNLMPKSKIKISLSIGATI